MRWKGKCAYDGTGFYGWQSQTGGNTIQDFLEARLVAIFGHPIRIHASGRTDSGVHAKEHVFHFDADWPRSSTELLRAFRCGLPAGIQVYQITAATESFHARYSASGKRYAYSYYLGYAPPMETRYTYSIGERPFDIELMREGARYLIGKQDYSAFGAAREDDSKEDPVKDIWRLDIQKKGPRIRLVTEGSGYLYKMVRSFAGTLLEVGLGKLPPKQIQNILETKKRNQLVITAPAKGLCLEKVYYNKR